MSNRKTRVTFHNITMAYLMGGVSSVKPLLADHSSPLATLDKTIEWISENDSSRDTSDLQALRDSLSASSGGGRGAKPLSSLGAKDYSVQQVGEGDLFIRLPVSCLGVQKGERVRVTLAADATLCVSRL
jgi:molybdopterin biosynthesis enzyme